MGSERPLYLDNRKSAAVFGTSGSGHFRTHALQQEAASLDHLAACALFAPMAMAPLAQAAQWSRNSRNGH
jgi:hypothetical protein